MHKEQFPKAWEKKTGGFEDEWASLDYSVHNIVEIGNNTEKSPGELKKYAVSQTPYNAAMSERSEI